MKARILLGLFVLFLVAIVTTAFAQDPVQRPGYGYRNEVDTSKHLINGFGIGTLDFNGTANAVVTVDSSDVATPYDISLKLNTADSTGTSPGNYVTQTQKTTGLSVKLNTADSTGNAVGNYVTHKHLSTTYAPLASPTLTGTLTVPTLVISTTDTTGTPVLGAIVFQVADSTFYGCRSLLADRKWYKLNE